MKFVTFFNSYEKEENIIVFPDKIQHAAFADKIYELSYRAMRPISAGFVVNGSCTGKSISLRLSAREVEDTELLRRLTS